LIITPKNENSIFEMIEQDQDLINLVDGDIYYRVWRDGKFQVDQIPKKRSDGTIILPTDSVVNILDKSETNINIQSDTEEEWDKFWKTHTVSHYIIKDGFNLTKD
tara:strand:+ start:222 stop:536 length:315 start_codon:yes stop_codon:yes gene_type:complete